jgi:hypothetical protein
MAKDCCEKGDCKKDFCKCAPKCDCAPKEKKCPVTKVLSKFCPVIKK